MAMERSLNSDQEVVSCSITCGLKSIFFKRLASPTPAHPSQPQAGIILKHLLVIQADTRTQPFCCLTPESCQPPLYTCCHAGVNLKHPSLIKTWVTRNLCFSNHSLHPGA